MENLLYGLLGWISGLLSNVIIEWNHDRRQATSLRKALRFELASLRNRMASLAYMLSVRSGALSSELATWLLSEFNAYQGPDRNEAVIDAIQSVVQHPREAQAVVAKLAASAGQKSLALKKYPTPAIDAAISELTLFRPEEQEGLLELRTLITNFDALVDEAWHFFQLTFDSSLTAENRQKVDTNIETAYRQALALSQRISAHAARLAAL